MNIKTIKNIIFMLTIAAMSLSCSKAFLFTDDSNGLNGKEGILIISGIVTDRTQNEPLEKIQISFQCDAENFEKINTSTDENGIFVIKARGFKTAITGCITARDPEEEYQQITRDIKVNWKGDSYDEETGLFAINDCNFQLKEK